MPSTPRPVSDPPRSRGQPTGGFRPDLEGLRAVAVLLVLLYHAGVPGLSGGYVGVDVFFVLSGFLITGLLARELSTTGRIDLVAFYARRARRLLPAAMLVIVVTLVASILLLPALQVVGIAQDAAASALYASNMLYAVQATDYLQSELAPSPLLHYWSLGVEEQFYLLWPALLMLLATRAGAARDGWLRRVGIGVVVVAVGSLGLSLVLTSVAPPWAFFSLPTRAWELGLGAVLALAAAHGAAVPRSLGIPLGWLGLAMILLAGVVLDTATPFPGLAALLPTLGAALVILAGIGVPDARRHAMAPERQPAMASPVGDRSHRATRRIAPAASLLSTGPARFLGRISYSLYLWHWPLIVIPAAALGAELSLPVTLGLAALAIPIAAASQRWVEEPLRHGRFVGALPRRNVALALVASFAVAFTSLNVATTILPGPVRAGTSTAEQSDLPPLDAGTGWLDGSPDPTTASGGVSPGASAGGTSGPGASLTPSATPGASSPSASSGTPGSPSPLDGATLAALPPTPQGPVPRDLLPPLSAVQSDSPVIYANGCHADQPTTVPKDCTYGDATSRIVVALVGDSHAAQWFPALERLAVARHWRLVPMTKSGCPMADVTVWNSIYKRAYTECDTWRGAVLARIKTLRPSLTVVADSRSYQLMDGGGHVAVGTDRPRWDEGLQRTLGALRASSGSVALIADTPRPHGDPTLCLSGHLDDALACANPVAAAIDLGWLAGERAVATTARVAFVDPTLWVCPSAPCPAVIDRYQVFRDSHHLTTVFSRALAGLLDGALPPIPGDTSSAAGG